LELKHYHKKKFEKIEYVEHEPVRCEMAVDNKCLQQGEKINISVVKLSVKIPVKLPAKLTVKIPVKLPVKMKKIFNKKLAKFVSTLMLIMLLLLARAHSIIQILTYLFKEKPSYA
jgi:hypothetical protein